MNKKFYLSILFGLSWLGISTYFAVSWVNDISVYLPEVYVWFVVLGIALMPGFLMGTMFFSNVMNKNVLKCPDTDICVSVIMCAKDEEKSLSGSIKCLVNQTYKGKIKILVVDNNSKDKTKEIIEKYERNSSENREVRYVLCSKCGKCNALNCALGMIETEYFITVDADTFLDRRAVQNIMNHITYKKCGCVAGNLFAKSGRSLISRMQIYDYMLSIAAIKRFQGSYKSTLVAQGAFSAFSTVCVKKFGGWKKCLGEDIVLTYEMLKRNIPSTYEPTAVGYTGVPETMRTFIRQRKRWAIGMLEGFAYVKPWQQGSVYSKFFSSVNVFVIFLDLAYVFGFVPGVVMCVLGYPFFVSVFTLYAVGISLILFYSLYRFQLSIGIPFKSDFFAFFCFLFFFQVFQSIAALYGYAVRILRIQSAW